MKTKAPATARDTRWFIVKLTERKKKIVKDYYVEWSTIVDAPISYPMPLEQAMQLLGERMNGKDLGKAIKSLETNSCSSPFYSIKDIISTNADNLTSVQQMLNAYCKNSSTVTAK